MIAINRGNGLVLPLPNAIKISSAIRMENLTLIAGTFLHLAIRKQLAWVIGTLVQELPVAYLPISIPVCVYDYRGTVERLSSSERQGHS